MVGLVKTLAPGILIAMPQLQDPNFARTVVLMVEHSEEGSMGIVINRPTRLSLEELAKSQQLEVAESRERDNVFSGGPVEPYRGFVLHDSPSVDERTELAPGLFLSVTSDSLEPLLRNTDAKLRFCLGYAGWEPGQVEKELQEGSWLFTEASIGVALEHEPEHMWAHVIKSMGIEPGQLQVAHGVN